MTTEPVRTSSAWLALREAADAAARSRDLVEAVRRRLPAGGAVTVHDLGCGTGSMARWLSPRLAGPQHWVMHDRDPDLLGIAAEHPPNRAADGAPVTMETRREDITRLGAGALEGADLVTASALLDVLSAGELARLVATCAGAGCPVLLTLSVTGRVELDPADPFDRAVSEAFNDHQRRTTDTGRLLGPDAAEAAVDAFTGHGLDVALRPSPWRLGPASAALTAQWLTGWLAAACEQQPELRPQALTYRRRRLTEIQSGRLSVTVHHTDLLARPA